MTLNEKSAYLKGLMDGLSLNTETNEGKMIAAIVDLLGDITKKVTNIEDTTIAISDELDEIEEDLDAIEDFIMDEEDDEYDEEDFDLDEDEEEYEEGFDFGDEDSTIYEVECPVCGEVINFDEETLENGAIPCPNCGENLEFDFEDEEYSVIYKGHRFARCPFVLPNFCKIWLRNGVSYARIYQMKTKGSVFYVRDPAGNCSQEANALRHQALR